MHVFARWRIGIGIGALVAAMVALPVATDVHAFNPPQDIFDKADKADDNNNPKDDPKDTTDDISNKDVKDGKDGKDIPSTPEPTSVVTALIGLGLAGAYAVRQRWKKNQGNEG